jgi:hypothetical protein
MSDILRIIRWGKKYVETRKDEDIENDRKMEENIILKGNEQEKRA